jgi:hypothetical protein
MATLMTARNGRRPSLRYNIVVADMAMMKPTGQKKRPLDRSVDVIRLMIGHSS